MSEAELKPCPFCGRSGAILDEPLNEDEYGCFCNALCGAIGPCDEDGEKAVEFWNTRPIEDALLKRAEAAEARIHGAEFWANFVYPDGASPEEIQNELMDYHQYLDDTTKVYYHISGGKISKPNTMAFELISIYDDEITSLESRAEAADAQVAALTAALAAANEDAARLASVLSDDGKLPPNAKRLSLAAHRARVGGTS